MNFTRPIEWEIRGVLLIRGKPCDSQLGHGFGRSEPEAIAHWKQKRLSGWAKDACAVYGIPAPIFRVNRIVAALTLLGSLALASQPAWGVSEGNTLEIHRPSPRALVREGAICRIVLIKNTGCDSGGLGSNPNAAAIFTGETRDEAKRERNYDDHHSLLAPIDHGETCKTVYANHTQTECVTAGETAPISFTGANSGDAYAKSFNLSGARLWAVSAGPNCCFNKIQIVSPAVGGKRTDCLGVAAATFQALREQTGYRVAVPACNWNVNDNRHSNALVGCVQSTLEAPVSARAGGSPAPNGASQTSSVDRCSVLKRCVISARQHRRTVASEDASAGENPAAPPISPTASEATPTPRFNCRSENRLRTLRESEEPSEDGTHSSCNPALMGKLADGGKFNL